MGGVVDEKKAYHGWIESWEVEGKDEELGYHP